jgi:hypothetical protein
MPFAGLLALGWKKENGWRFFGCRQKQGYDNQNLCYFERKSQAMAADNYQIGRALAG